jgi:hypothetical protein
VPAFEGGQSSETTDGGRSWRDAEAIGKFINRFRFLGSPVTVGYAAGATVYKYSAEPVPAPSPAALAGEGAPAALLAGEPPAEGDRPVRLPVTVPEGSSRLAVNVWERFGRHVRRLLEETGPAPGGRTIEWDVTDDAGQRLRAGSYLVRVTVDDHSESQIVRVGD